MVDVTANFLGFFKAAFSVLVIGLVFQIMGQIGCISKKSIGMKVGYECGVLQSIANFVMVIIGSYARFSHEGQVCSGIFDDSG